MLISIAMDIVMPPIMHDNNVVFNSVQGSSTDSRDSGPGFCVRNKLALTIFFTIMWFRNTTAIHKYKLQMVDELGRMKEGVANKCHCWVQSLLFRADFIKSCCLGLEPVISC